MNIAYHVNKASNLVSTGFAYCQSLALFIALSLMEEKMFFICRPGTEAQT